MDQTPEVNLSLDDSTTVSEEKLSGSSDANEDVMLMDAPAPEPQNPRSTPPSTPVNKNESIPLRTVVQQTPDSRGKWVNRDDLKKLEHRAMESRAMERRAMEHLSLANYVLSKTALETPAKEPEQKPSQDKTDSVVYKVRYMDSKLDKQWQERFFDESDYENQKLADQDSILEMCKDVLLSQKARPGKDLEIASITDEFMTIHSPYLMDIMPKVVLYYPVSKSSGSNLLAGRSMKISKPYRMLGGVRPELKSLRESYMKDLAGSDEKSEEDDENTKVKRITIKHIERLEHEIDKVLEEPMRLELDGYRQEPPVASFDMLWLLFRPGTEVYTVINDETVCCRVLTPVWEKLETRVTMELRMWFLDFNGTHVDRRRHTVRFDSFEGKREILSLEAYPKTYWKDETLPQRMIDRGKKYMTFLQRNAPQCQYKGFAFAKQDNDKDMRERDHYAGRVVVDPLFDYIEHGPPYKPRSHVWLDKTDIWRSNTNDGSMDKYVNIDPKDPDLKLDDSQHILISRYIRGFTLGTRKWVWLHIDNLEECTPDINLIHNLAIDPEDLSMIKASVPHLEVRQRGDPLQDNTIRMDPIAGKGEGQIVLLHGSPGTGKTFTVECLAEYSARPLLRLSTGELGLDATLLERKLWKWFRMAVEWQAVLLIDEADVYLEQRGLGGSLEREAIVAVFLRSLEYYRGILFLTSNCVGKFDEAILSRVMLVVEFKDLEPRDRQKLRLHYQRMIESDKDYELYPSAKESLGKIDKKTDYVYNGREIKNGTALARSHLITGIAPADTLRSISFPDGPGTRNRR
ncbi:MAG: hypothetical protein Q9168_006348 [Polycauliona sp. 1 TL-2023]